MMLLKMTVVQQRSTLFTLSPTLAVSCFMCLYDDTDVHVYDDIVSCVAYIMLLNWTHMHMLQSL